MQFMNPSYYDLEATTSDSVNAYLSRLIMSTLQTLEDAGCVRVNDDDTIEPLMLGNIASQYYLSHRTVSLFSSNVNADSTVEDLLLTLAGAAEYDELPVRHNEDKLNGLLAKDVRLSVDTRALDDPHVKANLLLQAHFMKLDLPISDYVTDTKSVLDQSIRIIQALVDLAANGGWLKAALNAMHLLQMVMQGLWFKEDDKFAMLPYADERIIGVFKRNGMMDLQTVKRCPSNFLAQVLQPFLSGPEFAELTKCLAQLPHIDTTWELHNVRKRNEALLTVEVILRRVSPLRQKDARAYAPYYPKVKDESWWIVIGNKKTSELLALKRVHFVDYLKTQLVISPDLQEDTTLFLVSDCYIGLDQEYVLNETS
ncbi:hypothetical protein KP509_1Z085500 [Ceratopteris richardii]|nr:hypothetical protein KP509_1Z085500 [Ceratopteris richardii]